MSSKLYLTARVLLGLLYLVFGLNGFFSFIPTPEPTEAGAAFLSALAATGYMFPFIKVIEILCGAMLLSGKLAAFAAVCVFPITLNIFLYHTLLDPGGFIMGLVMLLANLYLGYKRWEAYKPMFR